MPYYPTIDEDLKHAKEILERGKPDPEKMKNIFPHEELRARVLGIGGTIYGEDIYPAYKLLESFVEEIERLRTERWTTYSTDMLKWAKETCHTCGVPWTDPRTGIEYPVPEKRNK